MGTTIKTYFNCLLRQQGGVEWWQLQESMMMEERKRVRLSSVFPLHQS
jgi:hypothetical protein